jgi:DHA1 family tetracycline resistance protein-like MFS transporter
VGALIQLIKHPTVAKLALVFFLLNLAGQSLPSTWSYYTMERFDWGERGVGFSLAYVGIWIAIVQGGLTRILIPKFGEERSVYIGVILNAIGMIGVGISTEGWMLYVATIPLTFGGLSGPSLQSLASKEIAANEQGELQGFLTSVMSITAILGPLLMPWLFSHFSSGEYGVTAPGAPFFASAILLMCGLFFAWYTFKTRSKKQ